MWLCSNSDYLSALIGQYARNEHSISSRFSTMFGRDCDRSRLDLNKGGYHGRLGTWSQHWAGSQNCPTKSQRCRQRSKRCRQRGKKSRTRSGRYRFGAGPIGGPGGNKMAPDDNGIGRGEPNAGSQAENKLLKPEVSYAAEAPAGNPYADPDFDNLRNQSVLPPDGPAFRQLMTDHHLRTHRIMKRPRLLSHRNRRRSKQTDAGRPSESGFRSRSKSQSGASANSTAKQTQRRSAAC